MIKLTEPIGPFKEAGFTTGEIVLDSVTPELPPASIKLTDGNCTLVITYFLYLKSIEANKIFLTLAEYERFTKDGVITFTTGMDMSGNRSWEDILLAIIKEEDTSGIDIDPETKMPLFSTGKGGRYWFDETRGLVSLRLLHALISHGNMMVGNLATTLALSVDNAKDIYNGRSNGYCRMDKDGFPVIKDDAIALMSELCLDELEAIYCLAVYKKQENN